MKEHLFVLKFHFTLFLLSYGENSLTVYWDNNFQSRHCPRKSIME